MHVVLAILPLLTLQTSPKLQTTMQKPGSGYAAKAGDRVTVHYTGKLPNGTKFDSSRDEGRTPFSFVVGAKEVIKGWDQGLLGKKVGAKFRLKVPPALGYSARGIGPIPPNSTLIFDIEVLKIEKGVAK